MTTDKIELIKKYCSEWDGMYGFNQKTKDIIGEEYPFMLLQKYGILFSPANSNELKSDQSLILRKAICRVGSYSNADHNLRFILPVKVAFHEPTDKIKLFHGLNIDTETGVSHELTWLSIKDNIVDFANNIKGTIPENKLYFGLEIPKPILKETIMSNGISVTVEDNYLHKPNATTIFIKALKQLIKHYKKNGQGN